MKRAIISTIISTAMISAAAVVGAPSAATASTSSGVADCETGAPCSFRVGAILFESSDDIVVGDVEGNRQITGTVELPTPAGPIALVDAEMLFEPDGQGDFVFARGVTRAPFPSHWFGDAFDAEAVPFAEFGMQAGSHLHHLGAHVRDDREYLYFHFQTDLELALPWPDEAWADVMPQTVSFDAGYSATMVLDPTDPYLYVGIPCPSPSSNDDGEQGAEVGTTDGEGVPDAGDTDGRAGGEAGDSGADPGETTVDGTDGADEEAGEAGAIGDTGGAEEVEAIEVGLHDDEVGRDLDGEDAGEACGIGFSWHGLVPSPALARPMSGHLVIDAPMPVGPFMTLDGTLVFAIDEGVRAVGFGDVSAGVPVLSDVLDVALPLGDAIVEVEASAHRLGYAFDGLLESDGTYEIGFNGLPIALPGNGSARVASSFGFAPDPEGVWAVEPDGFFLAEGDIGVGPKAFGELAGVELDDFATAEARLHVDRTGLSLSGAMNGQIHPSLETDAGAALDLWLGFEHPDESFLTVSGAMRVAGTELGSASLDIDGQGAFVAGMLTNGITTVEMSGAISAAGVDVMGRTSVELPLDAVGRLAGETIAAVDEAQADVDLLEFEMRRTRATIMDERRATSDDFRLASIGVDRAQGEVDSVQSSIQVNNGKVSYLKRRIAAEQRRYRRLPWYRKATQWPRYLGRVGAWSGAIAGLRVANVALVASRTIATAALAVARDTLAGIDTALQALPVDGDPRMIGLLTAHGTATLTLQTTKAVAGPFTALDATVRAEAMFRIGTSGLATSLSAQWCTDTCTTLAAARLEFVGDGPQAGWRGCMTTAPAIPEVCGWL